MLEHHYSELDARAGGRTDGITTASAAGRRRPAAHFFSGR